jgi:Domain of unknown function (DUF4331)
MSHHYSGPNFGFPHGDARLDLTDLYAFPKPSEADKSILIMNVHPSPVVNPPGPTTREPFAPEALYELKIDTNGDAVADIAYLVRFSSSADRSQTATVRRVEGAQAAGTGDSGQVIIEAAPVSTGRDARVTDAGGYRFFAGWRSDSFFFDIAHKCPLERKEATKISGSRPILAPPFRCWSKLGCDALIRGAPSVLFRRGTEP